MFKMCVFSNGVLNERIFHSEQQMIIYHLSQNKSGGGADFIKVSGGKKD